MINLVEYIIGTKIKAAILQAFLESKEEVNFSSIEELSFAVACDCVRILEKEKLLVVNREVLNEPKK